MDSNIEYAFRRETILLAEDDPNDALLFNIALKKAGPPPNLQVVEDGDQAIAYLKGVSPYSREDHPFPSMLLVDLKMPRRDGFALLDWLFWRPSLRPKFVVVFSASDRAADVQKARRLGADAYLVKPHSPGELTRIIQSLNEHWTVALSNESRSTGGTAIFA